VRQALFQHLPHEEMGMKIDYRSRLFHCLFLQSEQLARSIVLLEGSAPRAFQWQVERRRLRSHAMPIAGVKFQSPPRSMRGLQSLRPTPIIGILETKATLPRPRLNCLVQPAA
jgi:hypothetical protein